MAADTIMAPRQEAILNADSIKSLPWLTIFRFGLVQASLGSIVALTTSTLNRVMVVELALAATIPGLLVALHYVVQLSRPVMGHGSDGGGKRTAWIIGGMVALALGALMAAYAIKVMATDRTLGLGLATLAFAIIGLGVSAAGTSLLALVARMAGEDRRAPAATILWIMMIAGIAITAGIVGALLDPFSYEKLIRITAYVGMIAVGLSALALFRVERSFKQAKVGPAEPAPADTPKEQKAAFTEALREVWRDRKARHFTVFVFVSMLAYSCQDLILEPFGGLVFGMTPGETTSLSGVHHGGAFLGMILVGVLGGFGALRRLVSLRTWMVTGCAVSGCSLLLLPVGGMNPASWSLEANIFTLGFANGMFTIGAIGSMMRLAGEGSARQAGLRMGLWGAAQAVGFGLGGSLGAFLVDVFGSLLEAGPLISYGTVFTLEAFTFLAAALIAARLDQDVLSTTKVLSSGTPFTEGSRT